MRGAGRDKEPNVCLSNVDHGTGSSVGILCGAVLSPCRSTSRSEIQGEQMLVVMSRGNIMKYCLIHKSRTLKLHHPYVVDVHVYWYVKVHFKNTNFIVS